KVRYLDRTALGDCYGVLLGLLGDAFAQPRAGGLHCGDGVLILEGVDGRDRRGHRDCLVPEGSGSKDLFDALAEAVASEGSAKGVSIRDRLAPRAQVRL